MNDYEQRFEGVARLYGAEGAARLRRAHVGVVGTGGVGSWTVEALARSGVGALTLVDLDEVCVTNTNRQVMATVEHVGRPKAIVLAERVRAIHPACAVDPRVEYFADTTAEGLLAVPFDVLVDAIDRPSLKALLIAGCRQRGRAVVTVGGAGGRRDPTAVRVDDLARTSRDPLLAQVRSLLRQRHGFPRGETPFEVPCVFSTEPLRYPEEPSQVAAGDPGMPPNVSDAARVRRFGTACFVTGTFGFTAAAVAVALIVNRKPFPPV